MQCENREESKEEENAKKGEENDTFISSIPSRVSAPNLGEFDGLLNHKIAKTKISQKANYEFLSNFPGPSCMSLRVPNNKSVASIWMPFN
jgi:hypothetical protein